MFSISAIDAALAIARHIASFELTEGEAVDALRRGPVDVAMLDYIEGRQLRARLDDVVIRALELERREQLRIMLEAMIGRIPPAWSSHFSRGRETVLQALDDDAMQLFQYAGLANVPLDNDGVQWWDSVASNIRRRQEADRTAIGRHGEQLSLIREKAAVTPQKHEDTVRWVALEDNALGYDIESWLLSDDGTYVRKFVEVKACRFMPLQFFLSRNEWDVACRWPSQYFIHVWFLGDATLTELKWSDVQRHIPTDQGNGQWKKVLIRI